MVKAPSDVLAQIGYAHLAEVMAVQARAYGPQFLEAPEVLGSKLRATGGTCWGAFVAAPSAESALRDASGDLDARASAPILCAYAIAHTVPQGAPLALNKVLAASAAPPGPADWLYVHDIAVDPDWAGAGLAGKLLDAVLAAGRRLSLRRAMLVAVQGADGYWARYGFVAQPPPMPVQGFGEGAVWMSRAL